MGARSKPPLRIIWAKTSRRCSASLSKTSGGNDRRRIRRHGASRFDHPSCPRHQIGSTIMVHGDDRGLVLPPRVAKIQVVIVPITYKDEKESASIIGAGEGLFKTLKSLQIRTYLDDRSNHNPGWKFNEWEVKGVPVRIEIGPKDYAAGTVRIVQRHSGVATTVKMEDVLSTTKNLLDTIHDEMFNRAQKRFDDATVEVATWKDFVEHLNQRKMLLTPWCEAAECEERIKAETQLASQQAEATEEGTAALTSGAKTICIPFDQKKMTPTECIGKQLGCKNTATRRCLFGRSY
eukprot:Selendium_serpulae@DN4794_c0_g1_i1.p2